MSSNTAGTAESGTWSPRLWGGMVAALAGSVATLIGVAAALEPDTILLRATCGACAAGACAWMTAALLVGTSTAEDAGAEQT